MRERRPSTTTDSMKLPRFEIPRLDSIELPLVSSVRGRIIAGFSLLLIILIVVVGGSAWLAREHRSAMAEMEISAATALLLEDVQLKMTMANLLLERYLVTGNESAVPQIRSSMATVETNLAEAVSQEEMRGNQGYIGVDDEAEAARLNELVAAATTTSNTFEQVIARQQGGDQEGARQALEDAGPAINAFGQLATEAADKERGEILVLQSQADRAAHVAFWLLVVSGVGGAILGVAASVFIARSILKPLSSVESVALAVAAGNLEARAQPTGPRELARMGAAFNRMTESLVELNRSLGEKVRELETEVTERKQAEEKFRVIVEAAPDAMVIANVTGEIVLINAQTERLFGYPRDELIGQSVEILVPERIRSRHWLHREAYVENPHARPMCADMNFGGRRKDGSEFPVEISLSPMGADQGGLISTVIRDVTEHKRAEETIRHLAYHDALTDLPNRTMFKDRLALALAQAHQNKHKLAVIFLDLDRFKLVNDTAGHTEGDTLLQTVGAQLRNLVREGDTVGRIGGDEFVLLLPEIARVSDASEIAQRILKALGQPQVLSGHEFHITPSIGITIFPTDGDDAEALLTNADIAMYHAKEQGRNNYQFYSPAMNASILERLALENDLRHGLEREEFVVYYQPQVNISTGQIVGMEALLRWQHPERGLVMPMEFVPVADETGLIVPLGEWVLRTACAQTKAWQNAGLSSLRVAVNLSARQFQQRNLAERVAQVLRETTLDPHCLQLEITESVAIQDVDYAIRMLRGLKEMGVQIAIDDFGTGHSALSYLRRLPIDVVKIDQSFIRELAINPTDAEIAATVIIMAHNLKLEVIAEGVETDEQFAFLKQRLCDEMQGNLFSRPVPAEEFEAMLTQGQRSEAA